ncbi:unnamed protein product [Clonostachys chloroleuca]|uniref:Uncharacterized protein n=1 Tax=Clonostachys chloroleuca TaxID=1926264 RepID=A0AA35MET8_9HYPO|nr:unnamed protein product [Clonostachys chloroleuca]
MTHETSALTRRFEVVAEVYCKPQTNDGREGRRLSASTGWEHRATSEQKVGETVGTSEGGK